MSKHPADCVPLTSTQERMWFLNRLRPESPAYNIAAAYQIRGRLDLDRLQRAIRKVIERHPFLRVRCLDREGEPFLVVTPYRGDVVQRLDSSDEWCGPAGAKRAAREFAQRPFDLARQSPVRVGVTTIGADAHLIVIVAHHLVFDGASLSIMNQELETAYSGSRLVEAPTMKSLVDAVDAQRPSEARLSRQLAVLCEQLAGVQEVPVASCQEPDDLIGDAAACVRESLGGGIMNLLKGAAGRYEVTPFTLLFGAYWLTLAESFDTRNFAVATPVSLRSGAVLPRAVGNFTNTAVLRVRSGDCRTIHEYLRGVKATVLGAMIHRHVPFDEVVRSLEPSRAHRLVPIVNTAFTFQDAERRNLRLEGTQTEYFEPEATSAKFDINLMISAQPTGLELSLEFASDRLESGVAARILERYKAIVQRLADESCSLVSRL